MDTFNLMTLYPNPTLQVKTFTEKPSRIGIQFIDSGDFLWNSNIYLESRDRDPSYCKHLRDMYDIFESGNEYYNTDKESEFIDRVFLAVKTSQSITAMENQKMYMYALLILAGVIWNLWGSLYTLEMDESGVIGNVILYNSSSNIVNVPKDKLVVLQGLTATL